MTFCFSFLLFLLTFLGTNDAIEIDSGAVCGSSVGFSCMSSLAPLLPEMGLFQNRQTLRLPTLKPDVVYRMCSGLVGYEDCIHTKELDHKCIFKEGFRSFTEIVHDLRCDETINRISIRDDECVKVIVEHLSFDECPAYLRNAMELKTLMSLIGGGTERICYILSQLNAFYICYDAAYNNVTNHANCIAMDSSIVDMGHDIITNYSTRYDCKFDEDFTTTSKSTTTSPSDKTTPELVLPRCQNGSLMNNCRRERRFLTRIRNLMQLPTSNQRALLCRSHSELVDCLLKDSKCVSDVIYGYDGYFRFTCNDFVWIGNEQSRGCLERVPSSILDHCKNALSDVKGHEHEAVDPEMCLTLSRQITCMSNELPAVCDSKAVQMAIRYSEIFYLGLQACDENHILTTTSTATPTANESISSSNESSIIVVDNQCEWLSYNDFQFELDALLKSGNLENPYLRLDIMNFYLRLCYEWQYRIGLCENTDHFDSLNRHLKTLCRIEDNFGELVTCFYENVLYDTDVYECRIYATSQMTNEMMSDRKEYINILPQLTECASPVIEKHCGKPAVTFYSELANTIFALYQNEN